MPVLPYQLTGNLALDNFSNPVQNFPPIAKFVSADTAANTTSTVTNFALTSNVVTLTTSSAHGYILGEAVTVALLTGPTGFASGNGIYVVTVIGSATTFSYAVTHADIGSAAATGSTVGVITSPLTTATSEVKLVFPPKSFGLAVVPLDQADTTWSYVSGGAATNGGSYRMVQSVQNLVYGIEGDTVYIQRPSTTKLSFVFLCGK